MAPEVTHWTENLSTWCTTQMGTHKRPSSTTTIDVKDDVRQFLENNRDLPLKKAKQRYAMQLGRIMKAALAKTPGNCKKAAGLSEHQL